MFAQYQKQYPTTKIQKIFIKLYQVEREREREREECELIDILCNKH